MASPIFPRAVPPLQQQNQHHQKPQGEGVSESMESSGESGPSMGFDAYSLHSQSLVSSAPPHSPLLSGNDRGTSKLRDGPDLHSRNRVLEADKGSRAWKRPDISSSGVVGPKGGAKVHKKSTLAPVVDAAAPASSPFASGSCSVASLCLLFLIYFIQGAYFILSLRQCIAECSDRHVLAYRTARCFCALTVPLSAYHCYEHLSQFMRPRLQAQIVRIILLVPVYSLEGALSISHPSWSAYLRAVREVYEAIVIYSFMRYLLNFLQDTYTASALAAVLEGKHPGIGQHKAPFCLLAPWEMGPSFVTNCAAGVFQYVIVRVILTLIATTGHLMGWYEEGEYSMFNLYTWMTGISCVSQMFALYCLLLFYHALHEELYAVRPFAKFVCIKLVVFFSWFQSVSIGALVQLGRIDGIEDAEAGDGDAHSPQEVAEGIQNLLITMEMLLAALAFYTSFSVSEFVIDTLPTHMQGGQYSALPTLPTGKATTISSTNEHDSDITPSPSPYETDTELELLHDFEIAHSAQSKASKDSLTGGSAIALKRPTVLPLHSTRSSFWGDIVRLLGGGVDSAKEKIDRTISTSSDQHSASDLSDDSTHGKSVGAHRGAARTEKSFARSKGTASASTIESASSPVKIPPFERKGSIVNSFSITPTHTLRHPFENSRIGEGRKLFEDEPEASSHAKETRKRALSRAQGRSSLGRMAADGTNTVKEGKYRGLDLFTSSGADPSKPLSRDRSNFTSPLRPRLDSSASKDTTSKKAKRKQEVTGNAPQAQSLLNIFSSWTQRAGGMLELATVHPSRATVTPKKRGGGGDPQPAGPASASIVQRTVLIWTLVGSFVYSCGSLFDQCLGLFTSSKPSGSVIGAAIPLTTSPPAMTVCEALRYVAVPSDLIQDLRGLTKGLLERIRAVANAILMRVKRRTTE